MHRLQFTLYHSKKLTGNTKAIFVKHGGHAIYKSDCMKCIDMDDCIAYKAQWLQSTLQISGFGDYCYNGCTGWEISPPRK